MGPLIKTAIKHPVTLKKVRGEGKQSALGCIPKSLSNHPSVKSGSKGEKNDLDCCTDEHVCHVYSRARLSSL